MIKIQIIGHLAHDNKLFDVQCTKCGMMYDSKTLNGRPGCLKCNSPLSSILTKNNRAMAISEGTIYPTLTDADKNQDAENVAKRKNAMPITHRFVLFSFANKETGVLVEPPVHQYLAKGREVMIEVGHSPIASWYRAKDKTIKLELRYIILFGKGDKIQLLGRKEVAETVAQPIQANIGVAAVNGAAVVNEPAATTNQVDPNTAVIIKSLQTQLAGLIAAKKADSPEGVIAAKKADSLKATDDQLVYGVEVGAQQNLFPTEDPFE